MQSNQFDFIHYTEIIFLSKTMKPHLCSMTSMSCKELFDNSTHLFSIEKVETHNFNFKPTHMVMYSFVRNF